MTPKEVRKKKDQELVAFIEKWSHELSLLKIQASVGQCTKSARIGHLKRDIARAKTVLWQRAMPVQETSAASQDAGAQS